MPTSPGASAQGVRRVALAALASLACAATLPAGAADGLALQQAAPGVFVHLGQPVALDAPGHDDIANIGFVIGSRCVAVIDSGGSTRTGRALLAAIHSRTTLPVCFVISTHVHVDHLLGNGAFSAGATQFIGHQQLPAAIAASRAFFLSNYAADLDPPADARQIVGPQRTVSPGTDLDLDLGGRHLRLRAWPKAHTDCDLTVFDERSGTLWTGDLVFIGRTPALDGSLTGWLAVLGQLAALPARHVVPGHGPLSDSLPAAVDPERRYLQALLAGVRREIADGKPLQQALAQVMPDRAGWLLWDETHPRNVARAYQELEWE